MSHLLKHRFAVSTILFIAAACGANGGSQSPIAPTAPIAPSVSPDATPITLGQTVTAVVKLSDPPCDTRPGTDTPDPCRRFAIAIPTTGILRVHVTSQGPNWLVVRVGSNIRYGEGAVGAASSVSGGATYEVSVGLHAAVDSTDQTGQSFELTTSLDSL